MWCWGGWGRGWEDESAPTGGRMGSTLSLGCLMGPDSRYYLSSGSNVVTRLLLADCAQNVVVAALPVFEKARERGSELSWEQACPDELLIELPYRLSMTRVAVSVGQVKRADSMKRSVIGARYGIIPGSFAQENLRDA